MKQPERIRFTGDVGNVARMKDGTLVTCYAEMDEAIVKEGEDKANLDVGRPERPVYLRTSSDHGRTWSPPRVAFAYPAGLGAVHGPCLVLVDRDDAIHAFNVRYFSFGDWGWDKSKPWLCHLLHTASRDGGRTWSPAQRIDFGHHYTGALNSVIQLDTGRIVLALSFLDEQRKTGRFVSACVYSDDGGRTWAKSNDCPVRSDSDHIESGAIEPVMVPLRSGMIWMLIRTTLGYLWESFSRDGACWTPPIATRLVASNAPAGVLRLRDDRLVLIWNNLYGAPFASGISYARQVLHGAISADDGQTWTVPKAVAERAGDELPDTQVCYPFPCQAADGAVVLVYYRVGARPERGWNWPVREIVRFDPDWLSK